ncbi:hypothetical protein AUJ68_00750 [Candidatus Woesearchaeota archaeon CG1_02_57_44]|nr:MAG: hypothetical protein AUJ68_00750 [Candidatus Woesearchaeota archaeon CG1_02_57_44]
MAQDPALLKILTRVKPDAQEQTQVKQAVIQAKTTLKSLLSRLDAKLVPGGSIAKGTWLSGNTDIDLFVQFPASWRGRDIAQALAGALEQERQHGGTHSADKTLLRVERVHGSRDYFHVQKGRRVIEIVPVLAIASAAHAENVTDISPLHVAWVRSMLTPRMQDEVRLAKQLCKASRTYGAESYIQGFSGYVLEILIAHHKSLAALAKAASGWSERTYIDVDGHYADERAARRALNRARMVSPLLLIDPVHPERNAAAALSKRNYARFKEQCQTLTHALDRSATSSRAQTDISRLFREQKNSVATLRKRGGYLIAYEATPLEGKEDVIGCKLLKAQEIIGAEMKNHGFTVQDAGWEWDGKSKALLWHVLEKRKIPLTFVRVGPPAAKEPYASAFRHKHPDARIVDGKLEADVRREYTDASKLAKALLTEERISALVKKIALIAS